MYVCICVCTSYTFFPEELLRSPKTVLRLDMSHNQIVRLSLSFSFLSLSLLIYVNIHLYFHVLYELTLLLVCRSVENNILCVC